MHNDTPITDNAQDKLGFGEMARHLSGVLLRKDLPGGFVVGIEGAWGSGKSSLANLTLMQLEGYDHGPIIIRFSPWLIGSRDDLLHQFFIALDSSISKHLPDQRRRHAKTLIRSYARAVARASPVIGAAAEAAVAFSSIPSGGILSRFVNCVANVAPDDETPSLYQLKEGLCSELKNLRKPTLVFIDDLDRLEPLEATEVLRLVKAVADFPNITYILAYDPQRLARCLQTATGYEEGEAYIEKIVQTAVKVPQPMHFDLRSWLYEEVRALVTPSTVSDGAWERLERAVSVWCHEYVTTPRDIVRVSNAMKVYVAPVADKVDIADGLFIQIVRNHSPKLYSWIESYVAKEFGSDSNNENTAWTDTVRDSFATLDEEVLSEIGKTDEELGRLMANLQQHLPRLRIQDSGELSPSQMESSNHYAAEHRLWSASYFRFYFALSVPSGSINDYEVQMFLSECENSSQTAVESFDRLCRTTRPQGGNMAQVLFSRILEQGERWSSNQVGGLFSVLGRTMDEFALNSRMQLGSPPRFYKETSEALRLLRHLGAEERMKVLKHSFENASSLVWLSGIVGEAIKEHGFGGFSGKPEATRLLNKREFEYVREEYLNFMKRIDLYNLREKPYFLGGMYVWYWAGGEAEARAWVEKESAEDLAFLDLLGRMFSSSARWPSMDPVFDGYLAADTLDMFFVSAESVKERLTGVAMKEAHPYEMRACAQTILERIEDKPQIGLSK